jgi:hypothetical protein|tara:strand:- start:587 stop:790 length:204 start_codon:yes stop_codon:yes gene_type:complete
MPQFTTRTTRNYGTDHEYIVEPLNFATLWSDITGRKTVTAHDLSNIKALAHFFESGLAVVRYGNENQ